MAKRTYQEIEALIDETRRRIETSRWMVCRASKLLEKHRPACDAKRQGHAVRLPAQSMERSLLLNQISDFTCIGRLLEAFRANGVAAAIRFDPDRGVEIQFERIDGRVVERLVVQVPLDSV